MDLYHKVISAFLISTTQETNNGHFHNQRKTQQTYIYTLKVTYTRTIIPKVIFIGTIKV